MAKEIILVGIKEIFAENQGKVVIVQTRRDPV